MSCRFYPHRLIAVLILASGRLYRYTLSNQREDLNKSIVQFTESMLILPLSWLEDSPLIFVNLLYFTSALLMHSKVSKQPEGVIYVAKYLFHLRDQLHDIPELPRHHVKASLVDAFTLQVELEAGNVMQNVRELAVFCRGLLTLETSDVDTTPFILLSIKLLASKIRMGVPDQPLDQLIEYLRAVRKHRSDLLEDHLAVFLIFYLSLLYDL